MRQVKQLNYVFKFKLDDDPYLRLSFPENANLPHGLDIYLVNDKTMRMIAQIFVAFSKKLNFML